MGRKLLIVASKRYGDYVKEIAESMGCFEEISFVDNDREGAIGKLEDVESFYPEYNCAIAACDDGTERLEWNKKLETLYNIPVLFHMDSTISPSANLMPGCIVEPDLPCSKYHFNPCSFANSRIAFEFSADLMSLFGVK